MYRILAIALFVTLIVVLAIASGSLAAPPANSVGVKVSQIASGRIHPHGAPGDVGFTTMGYSIGRPAILASRH